MAEGHGAGIDTDLGGTGEQAFRGTAGNAKGEAVERFALG